LWQYSLFFFGRFRSADGSMPTSWTASKVRAASAEMKSRAPTMQDVAAAAKVARATVSLALRNSHSLPIATRRRIIAVARRLGYRPNPLVSALMVSLRSRKPTERHTVLALVTSHPREDPWRGQRTFAEMWLGAQRRAGELGYRLEEFSLRAPGMNARRFVQMLRARNIHGLLINPLPHGEKSLEVELADFAVVGLGPSVAAPPIERVSNDHFQSAVLAMRQCHELGYRRVGLVVSREMSERLEDRWLAGYFLAQQQLPSAQRVEALMPAENAMIAAALLAWHAAQRPDAVLFGYFAADYQARLPPTVGLAALSVYNPTGRLTGIFQDSRRLGAIAVDHVVGRLQRSEFGPDDTARLHLMAGQWTPGKTARGPGTIREVLDAAALG
jgi:DNA-binding LacI/PurR family transcriptional regulator